MTDVDGNDDMKQLRDKMNLVVSTDSAHKFNDNYLKRYLKAHKSVHSAFEAILKTNKWRAEYGVDQISTNKRLIKKHTDKAQVLIHRDIIGRPVMYIPVQNHSSSNKNVQDLTKYFVHCLEEACKKCCEKVIDNICFVFDLNTFTLTNLNYPLLRNFIWLLDRHYPERLGVCLVINTPQVFAECWTMIKGWLKEETIQKITFVTSLTDLRYYLIPEILPTNKITKGHNPGNVCQLKENIGLEKFEWYVGDMSREECEELLASEGVEGCFLVRKSSSKGAFTISVYTKMFNNEPSTHFEFSGDPHTKHYHIKTNSRGEFFLAEKYAFCSIPELINYHRSNTGGLCSRLNVTPMSYSKLNVNILQTVSVEIWEIDPIELVLLEELGAGQFGVVRKGIWRETVDVAVKVMKEGAMSEDDFIKEAKVMKMLQHPNLVRLYGVCSNDRPIYIVTEYMQHGSLLNYLRVNDSGKTIPPKTLLEMAIQVCKGMAFLERHNYIHRDLAARNCLVKDEKTVKVADFGLARYVIDNQYTSSGGTKFPLRWAPLEVINYRTYSSKSDVWAFGILMWEIFTFGKMPYSGLNNTDVLRQVQQGRVLARPKICRTEIYTVMRACWKLFPEDRPPFSTLEKQLVFLTKSIDFDAATVPDSPVSLSAKCVSNKSLNSNDSKSTETICVKLSKMEL